MKINEMAGTDFNETESRIDKSALFAIRVTSVKLLFLSACA